MERMTLERQMKVIEILQRKHSYDLNFSMSIKQQWKITITNLASFGCDEISKLFKEGYHCNIYTNLATTDDGYGFQVVIF